MRPSSSIADDLIWYWNWAEGDLGVSSNYMAMVGVISLGRPTGGTPSTDLDERRFNAATKARLISRALEKLDVPERFVLYAAFGPHARELPILGKAAPLAFLTDIARTAHRESGTTRSLGDWLVRLTYRASKRLGDHVEADRAIAQAIADVANAALSRATRAFVEAYAGRSGKEADGILRAA